MTNSPQEPQPDPQTVEDLAPQEDESAELKGGWGLVVGTYAKPKAQS
jgi:hypothetical protein